MQNRSTLSEEGVDRIAERLVAKHQDSPIFKGMDEDQRRTVFSTAVRAVAIDALTEQTGTRLSDLTEEQRERVDQPLNRVQAPVDRVDAEVPRV